jgi:tryptophanase
MAKSSDRIKIIINPQIYSGKMSEQEYLPREGGKKARKDDTEQHLRIPFFSDVGVQKLSKEIEDVGTHISGIVEKVATRIASGVTLDEVKVGLAISGEGDIGFASAGMEASIELTFKIKP